MSTVLRWLQTNTAKSPRAPWVIARGATCLLLLAFMSTGVYCVPSKTAPPHSLAPVSASVPSCGARLTREGAQNHALAGPPSPPPVHDHLSSSSAKLTSPVALRDDSKTTATLRSEDVCTKSNSTQVQPHSPGLRAADISKDLSDRRKFRNEASLQKLVRELAIINMLSGTKDTKKQPSSSVKILKPSTSAKHVLEKLAFFPLASSLGLQGTSECSSLLPEATAPAELHRRKTSEGEHGKSPAREDGSVSDITGTAAAALLGVEQTETEGLRELTLKGPARGLNRQGAASAQPLEGKVQSEGSAKTETNGAKHGGERNVICEHMRIGGTKTKSGGKIEITDKEKGKIVGKGDRTAEGAARQGNGGENRTEGVKGDSCNGETHRERTHTLQENTANRQGVGKGETEGGQIVTTKTNEEQEKKRRRQETRKKEAQSWLADSVTPPQQKDEIQRKKSSAPAENSNSIPSVSGMLPSPMKTFPFVPAISPQLRGPSSTPVRRRPHGLRQKAVQLRNKQKWEDERSSERWMPCRKNPAAAKNILKGYDGEAREHSSRDGLIHIPLLSTVPRSLPPTSEVSAPVSAFDLWLSSPRETPTHSWRKAARAKQQNALLPKVTTGSATLHSTTLTDPLVTGAFHKGRTRMGGESHTAARTNFDAWSSSNDPGHRQRHHAEDKRMAVVNGYPVLPSTSALSIPSLTSSTSGIFEASRQTVGTLPALFLDSTESLARYIEPDDEYTEGVGPDHDARSYSYVWTDGGEATLSSRRSRISALHQAEHDVIAYARSRGQEGPPGKNREERGTNTGNNSVHRKPGKGEKHAEGILRGRHRKMGGTQGLKKSKDNATRSKKETRQKRLTMVTREKKADSKRVWKKTHTRVASGTDARSRGSQHLRDGGALAGGRKERHEKKQRRHYGGLPAVESMLSRAKKLKVAIKKYKKRSAQGSLGSMHLPVPLPPEEELVVDEKARAELGRRANHLTQNPLIERSSTGCLNVMSEILTPGTTITFEPRPQAPEHERFTPVSLVWGHPLGAGANGIVYEVISRTKDGRKVRFALKLALNRHQHVCNAWTRDKRGELNREERMIFYEEVQKVCTAEYEMEMKQRRLLSLPQPSPSNFSHNKDAGKLFVENQVCVPAAVGRIRGLPEYFVCPGGSVAVVNVAGLTPAASCNLYQILDAYDLSAAEKYELTRQVISAMSKLHALGLLHKDLKSENLIVTSKGRVIIADLAGAEPIVYGIKEPIERFDPGTVTFVAPERAASRLGRPGASGLITMKANAWSLGMMVYEIWCKGRDPFNLETLTDEEVLLRLDSMLKHRYPLSFKICPPIPRGIQKLIKALLQPDPRHRKVPVYFMWTLPLVRKAEFLKRSRSHSTDKSHA